MTGFTGVIFIGLLVLNLMSITLSQKLHEIMSQREREKIFLSSNVPDYEVVPIHWPRIQTRDVRSGSFVHLKAFGEHIKLWLNPTDGILASEKTPIYRVLSTPNGSEIRQYANAMKHIVTNLYEDLSKAATLVVNRGRDGRRIINGIIGSKNLAIRPVPRRFVGRIAKYRRSLDNIHESEYEDHHYHIVYKIAASNLTEPLKNSAISKQPGQFVPNVVYPEILVIVDHDLYKLFDSSVWEAVPYLLAFWNGVDMKFRNLENPRYRLNIAGIIMTEDADALEYIQKNKFDTDKLVAYETLQNFGSWLFKQDKFISVNNYDIATTMTSNQLCRKSGDDECGVKILGVAYVSGACKMDTYWKSMTKTMMIHDHAGYNGIHTAVHELGHSLGAHHDGTANTECSPKYGHIMAGWPVLTEHSSDWSRCSLEDFTKYLNENPKCIYNRPVRGGTIPRYLPGRILDANKQCQKIMGTNAYKIDSAICQSLSCLWKDSSNSWTEVGSAAAEGTSCGDGKLCLHEQCLLEREIYY